MSVRDCAKRGSAAEQSNGMTTRLAKELLACKSDAKVVGCSRNRLRSRSAGYRQSRWFSNVFLTLLELAFDHPSRREKIGTSVAPEADGVLPFESRGARFRSRGRILSISALINFG